MKSDKIKARFLGATCMTFIALGAATPVLAQEAAVPEAQTEAPDIVSPNKASAKESEDTIIVTGSRIRKSEFNSNAPIQVIDPATSRLAGTIDTAEMLQGSSIANGSSQITSAISSNFVTNGGPGASTISLRGLGAERTLVLLNGRRAGPAGTRGAVSSFDLNVLPTSIVQSVELLKDGASSIYGSDAIAGVVNLITKKKTNGLELDGYASPSFKGGGDQYRLSATWGKEFDRGNFIVAVDYYKRTELARGQRDYLSCPEDYIFREDGSRADPIDPRTGRPACRENGGLWGHVWLYDYSYIYSYNGSNTLDPGNGRNIRLLQYNYPGDNLGASLPPLVTTDPAQLGAPPGYYLVNYSLPASVGLTNYYHPSVNQQSVIPSTKRMTAYFAGEYDLTDNVTFYTEGLFNRRETYQNGQRQFWQFGFTSDSNLPSVFFGDPSRGDPAAVGFTGDYLISPTIVTDFNDSSQRVDYYRMVTGLKGDFGSSGFLSSWKWDVFAQFSRSAGSYTNDQVLDDSIAQQDFRTASCAGQLSQYAQRPCLDINWTDPRFLRGDLTAAEKAYLFGTETGTTRYDQWNVEVSANGSLFKLPGGMAALAIGAAWRRDSIDDLPGHITFFRTGTGPNDYVNNVWGSSASGHTQGHSITKEAFAELELPLLADIPMVKNLTLTGATRVTNVSATRTVDGFSAKDNGNWTYKLGANWSVNDWVRLRATYGTSYRAPALFEQFLADQTAFVGNREIDPCIDWGTNLANGVIPQRLATNCAAQGVPSNYLGGGVEATVITGGGIGVVKPETSTAKSVSLILTPQFSSRTKVSLAIDYFDIQVKGEIAQLGAGNIVAGCLLSDFFPTDPLCSLFTRGQTAAPFNINTVRDSFINVNSQRNKGLDFTLRIDQDLGDMGDLKIIAQATKQTHDTIALFAGTEVSSNGEAGDPKWVGDIDMTWSKGGFQLYYGIVYVGPTSDEADYLESNPGICRNTLSLGRYCVSLKAEAKFYHTISASQEFGKGRFKITAGISNLFNNKPPRVTTSVSNGGEITTIGNSVFESQYDMVGRRGFIGLTAKF